MQLTSPEDELAIRDIEKQLLSIESLPKSDLAHSPIGGKTSACLTTCLTFLYDQISDEIPANL